MHEGENVRRTVFVLALGLCACEKPALAPASDQPKSLEVCLQRRDEQINTLWLRMFPIITNRLVVSPEMFKAFSARNWEEYISIARKTGVNVQQALKARDVVFETILPKEPCDADQLWKGGKHEAQ